MKIAVSGFGRAGKDEFAEYLAATTSLRYVAGTSYWARHMVRARMAEMGLQPPDANTLWRDRHSNRKLWAEIIRDYNRDDPARLYRDCIASQDFLTGVRFAHEQAACRAAGLVDVWVWVENPRVPREETCVIGPQDCDFTIHNGGTLAEYHAKLDTLARLLGLGKPALGVAA